MYLGNLSRLYNQYKFPKYKPKIVKTDIEHTPPSVFHSKISFFILKKIYFTKKNNDYCKVKLKAVRLHVHKTELKNVNGRK